MRINMKTKAVLGITVLGTILGLGSLAVAAFIQTSTVDSVPGSTETFAPATVPAHKPVRFYPAKARSSPLPSRTRTAM